MSDWLVERSDKRFYYGEGSEVWWTSDRALAAVFDEDRAKALAADFKRLPTQGEFMSYEAVRRPERIEVAADVDAKRVAELVRGKQIVAFEREPDPPGEGAPASSRTTIKLDDGSSLNFEAVWGFDSADLETTWEGER